MYWKTIIALAALCLFSTGIWAQDNIALHKPVHEIGGPFGTGDGHPGIPPDVVTDGNFLPPGDDWFNGSWWLDSVCEVSPGPPPEPCALEIELQGWFLIESFIFQGDSDAYLLQYWDELSPSPPHWESAWEVPDSTGGMQTRPNPANNTERWPLPAGPIITNRLRVQVNPDGSHDGWNAVSEVQAFGESVPDPFQDTAVFNCDENPGESFETYLGSEEFCYKFKFNCEQGVSGAFEVAVDLRNGGVGFGGFVGNAGDDSEDPEDDDFCAMGFGHVGNTKIVHACHFEAGQAAILKVKAADGKKCLE